MSVRKAIFPVAGLGTRFLPATKSVPKEMLPVVDKPLLQYAVEEAQSAGIEQFIFVVSPSKNAIANHFGNSNELERVLGDTGKPSLLASIRDCQLPSSAAQFVVQEHPLGLGHAVWCARKFIDEEPFAVILPDDLVLADEPCLAQMVTAQEGVGGNMVAVMDVPTDHTSRYGVLAPGKVHGRLIEIKGLVEKPQPLKAPSTIAIIGRYILLPEIFDQLAEQNNDVSGEIQLTEAMATLIGGTPFSGFRFEGERYDCGDKVGFLEANIAYGLAREELHDDVAAVVLRMADALKSE
ncbi:MAG TPA: UTP--glucose-1-phosphate uridylyltransferase [Alphaproteobacteria bacterium]|nr:UTP--glucose-1-phosphate uridylyltransferase [Alphaproteobacteria bacterium]HIO02725.1 UTP--glucose-1-phosphate uridylyltransferase [Alphaproteobacteria bacterium]